MKKIYVVTCGTYYEDGTYPFKAFETEAMAKAFVVEQSAKDQQLSDYRDASVYDVVKIDLITKQ